MTHNVAQGTQSAIIARTGLTDGARSQAGLRKLWDYMNALVKRKLAEPGDDVISDLAAAAELVDEELVPGGDGVGGVHAATVEPGTDSSGARDGGVEAR